MSRVSENKQQKEKNLMDTAFELFTAQGIVKTSITEIVEKAGVAKGTFYLYFKDKYDLREKLVIRKTEQLFLHALENSGYRDKASPEDRLLAVIDDILFQLRDDTPLLQFISKNLSRGVFRRALSRSDVDFAAIFGDILGEKARDRQTLKLEVFMILELVGSTCHDVILESDPTDLDSFLPYLHGSIRAILHSFSEA